VGALVVHGDAGIGKTELLGRLIGAATGVRSCTRRVRSSRWSCRSPPCTSSQLRCSTAWRAFPDLSALRLESACGIREGQAPSPLPFGLPALTLLSDASADQPVVCVVDDAQWLDRSSAQALAFVARRLGDEHVAVLFAVRELSSVPELARLPTFAAKPLSDQEARALLAIALELEGVHAAIGISSEARYRTEVDAIIAEAIEDDRHRSPMWAPPTGPTPARRRLALRGSVTTFVLIGHSSRVQCPNRRQMNAICDGRVVVGATP
jgi:hypothetical protein